MESVSCVGPDGDVDHVREPGRYGWYIFGKITGELTSASAKNGGVADTDIHNGFSPFIEGAEGGNGLSLPTVFHRHCEDVSVGR